MSADYPTAQEHLVPRSFMFNSNSPVAVVIHKTGGDRTPQDVYNTFLASGNPGKSAHYAIGLDGTIWQYVPESLGAGANGIPGPNIEAFWQPYLSRYSNLNMCTISIEHCDPSVKNDTPLTDAQKQASFALVAHLCQKYGIAPDHIKPHKSIAATTCPGTYPMDELIAFVKSGGSMIPKGWKDDGHTLTAPNGVKVVLGFRTYILNRPGGWDPDDWPVAEEFHADPLEVSNPSLGSGQKLCFKRKELGYTAARGVFESWTGQEVYALLQALKAAKAQPAPEPEPTKIDTTAAEAAINDIINGMAPLAARAVVEVKKLGQ